jgi:hypothetical protein
MSVQNLFFCQAVFQKAIVASIFNNWLWKRHQYVLPAPLFAIFHTSSLLSLPASEIRAGKLLVDPGHLQEEIVGGRPHNRYRRACRRRPGVDRMLLKTHILLMTVPKNYLKQVSLSNLPFLSYVALCICFLTHLINE